MAASGVPGGTASSEPSAAMNAYRCEWNWRRPSTTVHSPRCLWWRSQERKTTHAAPRGQKEPPPETRPGVLKDAEPQLLDAGLAYRAAGELLVATPLLAAPAG